MMRERERED